MTPNDLLAGGCRMARQLVHRMIDDLTPKEMQHQPVPGANSAAWIVGHLALTLLRSAEQLGAAELPSPPAGLAERFIQTRQPAEEQTDLGDPAELVRLFDACIDALQTAVKQLPAEMLDGPSQGPGPLAANLGEGVLFGALHVAMHTGQLSTIRRSLGKPPLV